MSDLEEPLPEPPEPPTVQRRFRMHRYQWIGIPIVFLAPVVLALTGALGESWEVRATESPQLAATVHYPTRFRYKQLNEIRIRIESRTLGPLDTVTIALDSIYGDRFSTVRGVPAFERPYELKLSGFQPGEWRNAFIEIQAERYGIHAGDLVLTAQDTARIHLRTIVFP